MFIKYFKKHNVLILFNLFFIMTTFSCGQINENNKHILWELKGKTNSIYLLGDIDYLKKEDYPLPCSIENAFKNSSIVVLEVDYDSLDLHSSQETQFQNSLNKSDKTFKESVPKKLFDLSFTKSKEFGYDINDWKIRPLYLAGFLYYNQIIKLGCGFEFQVDNYFLKKAKEEKKLIKGLGSVKFYYDEYNNITFEEEESYLLNTLNELENIGDEIKTVFSLWKIGDIKKLEKYYEEKNNNYPNSLVSNFERKAKIFIDKIEIFLNEQENYLIILPIEYLIGKNGIIKLMKNKGYLLEQI